MSSPSASGSNSRRHMQASEESTMSTTSSLIATADAANTFVEMFDALRVGPESTPEALRRMLSINSTSSGISTQSTLARDEQMAQQSLRNSVNLIGVGTCAEVFSAPISQATVWKRCFPSWNKDLANDYELHRHVAQAFAKQDGQGLTVHVPTTIDYITTNDDHWYTSPSHGALLSSSARERRPVLISERIYPLPEIVRIHLINAFCHPKERDTAVQNPDNRDGLARVYLGRRGDENKYESPFTLRNFPLTLHKMDTLNLPKVDYARSIAEALAIIHWEARVDGRDIEFVIGSAPTTLKGYAVRRIPGEEQDTMAQYNFTKRRLKLWVLDFNQCTRMTLDAKGCELAVTAFWDNDPYYPRPTMPEESGLWTVFESAYLRQANEIVQYYREDIRALPAQFIRRVKEMGAQRFAGGASPMAPPKGGQGLPVIKKGKGKAKGSRNTSVDLDELLQ